MRIVRRLWPLLAVLLLGVVPGEAAEFYAYRATVSLPLQSATFENQIDRLITTRLSSKRLVNAVMGQPIAAKTPSNLVLVVLVPATGAASLSRLAILDTSGGTAVSIASVNTLTILSADDPKTPSVGIGDANMTSLPQGFVSDAEFYVTSFTIRGSGRGQLTAGPDPPTLSLKVSGLHATFTRNPPPGAGTPFYYAGVLGSGSLRASGKPIATVDL